MNKDAWHNLLSAWAAEAVQRAEDEPEAGPLSGLGFPGASEAVLSAVEARLGCHLPPSYREFLKCTNGLRQPSAFVAARGGDFWPAEEIDWFRVRNQEWVDAFSAGMGAYSAEPILVPDELYFVYGPEQDSVHFRVEYLRETLELSHDGDSSAYLLNPKVIAADGEWEAWFFANWLPGAQRFQSFAAMMLYRYENCGRDGF